MIESVRLDRVRKRYASGNFLLDIDDFNFHNRGVHVISGPNGSGKTLLLKLIAILDKPDEGGILYDGLLFNGHGRGRMRKRIGFLMQNPYLFNMTVFENVALGLKIRRYPKTEINSKVNDILDAMEMGHLASRNVKSLSRGEYQKTAVAQVLILEPDIILLDEPVANVDVRSIAKIERIVKDVQARLKGIVIMTTHSMDQANRMSSDIISINEGRFNDKA